MTDGYYSKLDKACRKMAGSYWSLPDGGPPMYGQQTYFVPPPVEMQPQGRDRFGCWTTHSSVPSGGPSGGITPCLEGSNLTVSRRDLFEMIHNKAATREMLTDHVLTTLKLDTAPQHVQNHVRQEVSRFFSRCMTRWKQCKRMKDRFLRGNAVWLNIEMKAAELVASADRHLASRLQGNTMPGPKVESPPPKPVEAEPFPRRERNDAGGRTLRSLPDIPPEEEKPKNRPKMSKRNAPVSYTPEEVLDNLIVKAKLTKKQYDILRDYALGINCYIYPSFAAIQKVMKDRAARGLPLPQVETDADSDGDVEDSSD
ncbi:hypothetical protein R5R35_001137 [Gryllus longicercus]|nr:Protein of unknown function [Gryllus bimaculatus]